MAARGCLLLAALLHSAAAAPVPAPVENDDVEVMKCIVEVMADVLSRPRPLPVSQQCLETLRSDERLVSVLRHRNFLRELQDIAVEGASGRANQNQAAMTEHVTLDSEDMEGIPDHSMLSAVERPGETPSQAVKRGQELEGVAADGESQEHNDIIREREEYDERNPSNHISDSMNQSEEELEKGGAHHEKASKTVSNTQSLEGTSEERRSPEEEKGGNEGGEEVGVRRTPSAEGEEQKKNMEEEADAKHWMRVGEKRAEEAEEASHHSKEALSPGHENSEEQELQMMVQRHPKDQREEEGSASRKAEDHEIESLAAIESELENVAQKLHELRKG
ncbi:chromogranin-A [Denticeps clupeoides]|uniref:chromogranin-A n=1 Tax=Denticeps clupeoides TaxID=299321 RepID=UPI0010A2D2BE|nr:chromogranin-A [Denticeps clupeoides]